jgi:putative PIN family toxin of toxin-antitoxin system
MPPGAVGASVRAVLDPNVLISALLAPAGAPAQVLMAWLHGEFELMVSPLLLEELARALGYPKLRRRIGADEAHRFVDLLARTATMTADPETAASVHSRDPGDNYLIALAEGERAVLVSGDAHLLELEGQIPVFAPAAFLARFGATG